VVSTMPWPLYPRGRHGTHCMYRRLGGPQGRSGRVRKILPTPGFFLNVYSYLVLHCSGIGLSMLFLYRTLLLDCNGRLVGVIINRY
jgi:hypothetical protein